MAENESMELFERRPAFQVNRFKKNLHSDFNSAFAGELLTVLYGREDLSAGLKAFRERLHGVQGSAHPSFQLTAFGYYCYQADFNERLAEEILDVLNQYEGLLMAQNGTMTPHLYMFRRKLAVAIHDGFTAGQPYKNRRKLMGLHDDEATDGKRRVV